MLQRIFLLIPLVFILPDIYIYQMFLNRRTFRPFFKLLYWLPTLLLLTAIVFLTFFADKSFFSQHTRLLGIFGIIVFLFTLPKLFFALCSLIGWPFHYLLHWARTPFTCAGLIIAFLSAALILYGALIGRTNFEVKEICFYSSRLPESFQGYRIVQLSDIHLGSWEGNEEALQRAVDKVNALHPDLIVFTGDLVNHRTSELDGFQHILCHLQARDGIYSVLGNHDYGPYYSWNSKQEQADNLAALETREAEMGWKLLNNTHVVLHHQTDSIALIGVENEGEPPFSQHGDLSKALLGTEGMFQLLLSHNPTHWRREVLPHSKVDLMLSGHTHAMQLSVGHHSPASYFYPEWSGLYTAPHERALYVNIGLGSVGIPSRLGARPEITVITLLKK